MITFRITKPENIAFVAQIFINHFDLDNPDKKPAIKCFAFYGDLGAGKTTFIKALCKALGVGEVVNSPSFAIINEYKTKLNETIYHFDFYRIKKAEEVFDLGYEEYFFSDNLCFIEWPEMVENLLPPNCKAIHIHQTPDNSREIYFD